RPAAALQHALEGRLLAVDDNAARTRDGSHQMVKLRLDRRKIGEDVRMVEFEVVEDGGARPVVHELRTLVEKGGVVLVGLDHKECGGCVTSGDTEVLRYAADQKTGGAAGVFQDPGQHGGGGSLAVRPRDGEYPLTGQHMLCEPLRPGDVWIAAIENGFHERIAAGDDVADHPQVRTQIELLRAKPADDVDALLFELFAHGRIDVGVAAGHAMTRRLGKRRDTAHEGAADAEYVDMHGRHSTGEWCDAGR